MAALSRSYLLIVAALGAAVGAGGCRAGKKQPPVATTAPAPQENWTQTPIAMPAQPDAPVKEGPSPLIYFVESAAIVRIVDLTDNQEVLRTPVPARTLVAVEDRSGVRIGGTTMRLGPLPEGHRYAIYLQANETNLIRSGTIRPGKKP